MCAESGADTALRIALVLLHLLTVAGGFMTGIGLGWTTRIYDGRCLLFSDMELELSKNNTLKLDLEETKWGSLHVCYYCTFATGMASIYGIIWFWFYFLLSEWDATEQQQQHTAHFDWSLMIPRKENRDKPPPDAKLLCPTMLINCIQWVCIVAALGLITRGSNAWCDSIFDAIDQQCRYVSTVSWSNVQDGDVVYTYLRIAQAGNWILMFSILAKMLVVGCRIYLYIKRDLNETRAAPMGRHHTSFASKYVTLPTSDDAGDVVTPHDARHVTGPATAAAAAADVTSSHHAAVPRTETDDDDDVIVFNAPASAASDVTEQSRPLLRHKAQMHSQREPTTETAPDSIRKKPQSTPKQQQQQQQNLTPQSKNSYKQQQLSVNAHAPLASHSFLSHADVHATASGAASGADADVDTADDDETGLLDADEHSFKYNTM